MILCCFALANTSEIVHPDEVVAQSFALLAMGDFAARPKVATHALLDDIATVISDGATHAGASLPLLMSARRRPSQADGAIVANASPPRWHPR